MKRRDFLKAAAMTAVGALAVSCAQPTPQVIEKEVPVEKIVKETVVVEKQVPVEKVVKETVLVQKEVAVEKVVTATPVPAKFKEAPMLAELVKQGKLPPVEERLPLNPVVCPVMEMIGQYGGTIRRGFSGVSDRNGPIKLIQHNLTWYTPDVEVRPHAAESWETNENATVWTWHLRKGMKWSDGAPFTSEAFSWYQTNVVLDKDLTPTPPRVLAEVTAPDAYTVVMKYADPNPLLAATSNRAEPYLPGHYLKQFHMAVTSDKTALEKAAKDAGFAKWQDYYWDRSRWYMNPEMPGIGAWMAKNPLSEELFIMERNPYFFGVDPEGNQLPYTDRVTHRLYSTADVFNMWIVGGEIDFQARGTDMGNYSLYKENEQKGGYKVALAITPMHISLFPNENCKEERIRELNQNRDVRIAISLAINRTEINDLVYDGQFAPRQYSPLKGAREYYPKAAEAYIEYDPKKANDLLDQAGYSKKGSDGIRLWKDGSGPISIIMEGTAGTGTPMEDAGQMVVKYLADVGLKVTYKAVERSLYEEHFSANEIEWAWWTSDYTLLPLLMPDTWLATMLDNPWAPAWGTWRMDPTAAVAEKPRDGHWIWDIWKIWDTEVSVEIDPDKRVTLFHKILDIFAREMPMPTVLGDAPSPCIVKNGLRNYVEGYPDDGRLCNEHFLLTETYFWEEPERHV